MANNKNGHWYTDKNGHHYFVENGQTPKEGWEASKRRKMIDGGEYKVSEDGNEYKSVSREEYEAYEADDDFDINNDDDFGFDDEPNAEDDTYMHDQINREESRQFEHVGEEDDKYMSGQIFYTGDHAYKITDVNDEEVEFIDEKGHKQVASLEEFKNTVESDEYDTHGITEEEAKSLGLDTNNWNENEKPLHIKSLENQVSKNPDYKKIADSLSDKQDINDAYFYAFKDAYEKHNYEPSNKHIADELSDRYWALADSYRDRYGMSDGEWDRYGVSRFEEEYGTESDFIDKGIESHNKYFDDLGKPDATTYNGAEVIGGDNDNEGMLKNKTPLSEEQSKMISNKNWYDDLEDNEYTKNYRERAMKVDPERSKMIAALMDEYVSGNPTRGVLSPEDVKKFSEKLNKRFLLFRLMF